MPSKDDMMLVLAEHLENDKRFEYSIGQEESFMGPMTTIKGFVQDEDRRLLVGSVPLRWSERWGFSLDIFQSGHYGINEDFEKRVKKYVRATNRAFDVET